MKKIIALLLSLSLVMPLSACAGNEDNAPIGENTEVASNTENNTTGTEESVENGEGNTSADKDESTEEVSTENCEHAYTTDGLTDCKGIMTYTCSKCQHSYGVETGKIDHKTKHYYTKQPTLTEEGIYCIECIECYEKEIGSAGKLLPTENVYITTKLHCFLETDSPLNTELYTWQGKAKGILCNRYPDAIPESELFTSRKCWEYDISNEEIQKIKTSSHYNPSTNMFISYDDGTHPPVLTSYLGYVDNGDGTITAYTTFLLRINMQYVESGYCKVQMKYGTPPTNEQKATFHITSIMRVDSIPGNLTE